MRYGSRWDGWPDPADLSKPPDRLVLHWTAGGYTASDHELFRYHALIEHHEGDPEDPTDDRIRMVQGVPVARNCGTVDAPAAHADPETGYAAHVRLFNSGSIGLAACAMRGAVDRRPDGPVDPGPSPLTRRQTLALIKRSVEFCATYHYSPTEGRLMTHMEVETFHGVEQRGKWNVSWLPGMNLGKHEVGPWIRAQVRAALDGRQWATELKGVEGERSRDQVREMVG